MKKIQAVGEAMLDVAAVVVYAVALPLVIIGTAAAQVVKHARRRLTQQKIRRGVYVDLSTHELVFDALTLVLDRYGDGPVDRSGLLDIILAELVAVTFPRGYDHTPENACLLDILVADALERMDLEWHATPLLRRR